MDLAWLATRPEAPLILLAALVLDALIGDPLSRAHPVALLGRLVADLDRRLNRPERGTTALRARGAFTVAVATLLAAAAGLAVHRLAQDIRFGWTIEALFVAILLAQRSLFVHVDRVARALDREGLEGGRRAVAHIVGRDVDGLDAHGVARGAIESAAENFADGVVAPTFWYLLLGPAGIAVYKAINTLDSMIGYRDSRYQDFGRVAARLDDAANWFPARIAALLLVVAASFVPTASPARAARTAIKDARKHASPNAGWPEAAMAGALDLALNGPRSYGGAQGTQPWVGAGRARATPVDIHRALYLYAVACLLNAALVAAVAALI